MKFDATREGAFVILEINLHDAKARLDKYEQFEQYKSLMEKTIPRRTYLGILPIFVSVGLKFAVFIPINPVSISTVAFSG